MAGSALSLHDVTMTFAENPVLQKVSLDVPQGECLVLIGPSGRGKSVVLKLLAGLLEPTGGEVRVEEQNLAPLSHSRREKHLLQMGMLFQKNALFDSLTVGDNIAFPLREKTSLNEREIREKVDYFLDQVGILHARDLFPDEISGGMQKRLGIARALALDPKIVLYDDPTAGLDPITSRKIIELILRLREEHRATVVAVTNDMARAYQMAGRIAMVVDRELIVTGDKDQTLEHKDPRVQQFIRGQLTGPLTEAAP